MLNDNLEFRLRIELGNAAMLTGYDVARSLRAVAATIDSIEDFETADPYDRQGRILDVNGNRVGFWKVERAKEETHAR